MHFRTLAIAAAAVAALALGAAATSASAAVTLAAGESGCDLYTTGCLFNHGGNGEFDDPGLIVAAYNAGHDATPPPEDLPELAFLGKTGAGGVTFVNNGASFVFTDLPFDVGFYSIKTGDAQILVFGLNPATDSFTATNGRILNDNFQPRDISHVTFFGAGVRAIPEPATWAMTILGFGGVGSVMRRRRHISVPG